MKVRELIELLQRQAPDDEVMLEHFEDGPVPIDEVQKLPDTNSADRHEVVFILAVHPHS